MFSVFGATDVSLRHTSNTSAIIHFVFSGFHVLNFGEYVKLFLVFLVDDRLATGVRAA